MDSTMDDLEKKGYYNPEKMGLEGVLLRIEKVDVKSKDVSLEGSKFKSGKGAIGMRLAVDYENGEWQLTERNIKWKS